jgi:hypothetical protein
LNTSIGGLSALNYLDLSGNSLATVGPVASLLPSEDPNRGGSLQSLYVGCNPTFDCSSLQLTTSSPVLQQSQCAAYNTQDKTWITLTHPTCNGRGVAR